MNRYETNGQGEKMIGSMRVESVSVPVGDQERAEQFYVGTLGFDLLVDDTWREGMRWSEVAPEGSATSLMLVSWQSGMLPGMHRVIVMATGDIEALHRELVSKDIDFELPPTQTHRGTQAMFRDSFGNPLMLWEHAVEHHWGMSPERPAFGQAEGRGGLRSSMRPEEAQIGKRVRVRNDHRKMSFRGREGTIAKRWGNPGYPALDVLLDEGDWQLFWYHELEPVDKDDIGARRQNGVTVGQ